MVPTPLSLQAWAPQSFPLTAWRRPAACWAPPTAARRPWWRRGGIWPRASGWSATRSAAWATACNSSREWARRVTASPTCWPAWSRSRGWTQWSRSAPMFWAPVRRQRLPDGRASAVSTASWSVQPHARLHPSAAPVSKYVVQQRLGCLTVYMCVRTDTALTRRKTHIQYTPYL